MAFKAYKPSAHAVIIKTHWKKRVEKAHELEQSGELARCSAEELDMIALELCRTVGADVRNRYPILNDNHLNEQEKFENTIFGTISGDMKPNMRGEYEEQ